MSFSQSTRQRINTFTISNWKVPGQRKRDAYCTFIGSSYHSKPCHHLHQQHRRQNTEHCTSMKGTENHISRLSISFIKKSMYIHAR